MRGILWLDAEESVKLGKQTQLIEYFVAGATARTAAALGEVNNSTAAYYFHRIRKIIAQAIQMEMPLAGEIEVDESYFGGRLKVKGGPSGSRESAGVWDSQAWGPCLYESNP